MRSLAPARFGLAVALSLLVPITIFAVFTRATIDSELTARAQQDREITAGLAAALIRQRLDGEVADLARFAGRADVLDRAGARDGDALRSLLSGFSNPYAFKFAGVIDPTGRVVANIPTGEVDPSFARDVLTAAAAQARQGSFMSPDGRPPSRVGTSAVIIAPLAVGSEMWAVYGLLDCTPFASVFAPLQLQDYRALALVDANGHVLASSDPSGLINAPSCTDIIEFPGVHVYTLAVDGVREAVAAPVGTTTAKLGESELLATHVTVIPGHWALYLFDSPARALQGERRLTDEVTYGAAGAALVALALSALLAYLVARVRRQGGDLARLAVTEERLRIARDLHDLLGRGLSLVAMKADLAGRLIAQGKPAEGEVRELEQIARDALRDLRDAVVGYRQPSLSMELDGARSVLEAAGISCRIDGADVVLPAHVDALFAWAVREGITNVVRHSGAGTCEIAIDRDGPDVALTVIDDGHATPPLREGHGLVGLQERARDRGARTEYGPLPGRGFRLRVIASVGAA